MNTPSKNQKRHLVTMSGSRWQTAALVGALAALSISSGGGCKKASSSLESVTPGTPQAPRKVAVQVSNQGFTPARIAGRPGESLVLVFSYNKSAGECGREVVLPAQNLRATLSEDKPSELALTLPTGTGEVTFTCGMNMLRGAIILE